MLDEPTLSERDGIRYLHLGSEWIQGAMRLKRPDELVLDYTRQMMVWLLFVQPEAHHRIAILGLGAGSLLRYTLRHTPVQLTTVEYNPQVVSVCRAFFRLPESPRSTLVHADAQDWIGAPEQAGSHDVLLVDLYDSQAQGPVCSSLDFYQNCADAIIPGGVMVVNLFGHHASYQPNIDHIRTAFHNRVLQLPTTPAGNRVVLGLSADAMQMTTSELVQRAETVEGDYKLPAVRWARALLASS